MKFYYSLIAMLFILTLLLFFYLKPDPENQVDHFSYNNPRPDPSSLSRAVEKNNLNNQISEHAHTSVVDSNNDGIPDHINDYINSRYSHNLKLKNKFTDLAKIWAASIKPNMSQQKAQQLGEEMNIVISCITSKEFRNTNNLTLDETEMEMRKARELLLNSEEKIAIYSRFNRLLDGQYYEDLGADACNLS